MSCLSEIRGEEFGKPRDGRVALEQEKEASQVDFKVVFGLKSFGAAQTRKRKLLDLRTDCSAFLSSGNGSFLTPVGMDLYSELPRDHLSGSRLPRDLPLPSRTGNQVVKLIPSLATWSFDLFPCKFLSMRGRNRFTEPPLLGGGRRYARPDRAPQIFEKEHEEGLIRIRKGSMALVLELLLFWELNENYRSVVTVNTIALTMLLFEAFWFVLLMHTGLLSRNRQAVWIQSVPLVIHPTIGLRFPFRNLLHLNEVVRTATIEKNAHGGALQSARKKSSDGRSGGTGSATTEEETSPFGSSTCRIMRLGDDITSDLGFKTIKKEDRTKCEIGSKIAYEMKGFLSSTVLETFPSPQAQQQEANKKDDDDDGGEGGEHNIQAAAESVHAESADISFLEDSLTLIDLKENGIASESFQEASHYLDIAQTTPSTSNSLMNLSTIAPCDAGDSMNSPLSQFEMERASPSAKIRKQLSSTTGGASGSGEGDDDENRHHLKKLFRPRSERMLSRVYERFLLIAVFAESGGIERNVLFLEHSSRWNWAVNTVFEEMYGPLTSTFGDLERISRVMRELASKGLSGPFFKTKV
ncbi:unnamed protein product [Sphenostylis stenocarpa]|uniref:Uncharacterized protein n=1 Tax=Sphenostylis stenocarpa TaxID=92480 RepID=A0AA86T0B1_9FABA|nr:unnamed protein product [Sphenostylis stenocarpa]